MANPTPLVLLVDEIDSLVGDTLLSVLRQLRAGYEQRPEGFPQSVVLCGVREIVGEIVPGHVDAPNPIRQNRRPGWQEPLNGSCMIAAPFRYLVQN